MNHNTLVIEIKSTLDKLIAARTSLGYDYIVYGLLLINEDQTRVSNITKALYIDIAAHYETSWSCVEKNIRNTVNAIWTSENKTILEMIFNRFLSVTGYCSRTCRSQITWIYNHSIFIQ